MGEKKVTEDGVGRPSSLSVERGGGGCLQSGNLIALLKRERWGGEGKEESIASRGMQGEEEEFAQ